MNRLVVAGIVIVIAGIGVAAWFLLVDSPAPAPGSSSARSEGHATPADAAPGPTPTSRGSAASAGTKVGRPAAARTLPPPPSNGDAVLIGRVIEAATHQGIANAGLVFRHPRGNFALEGSTGGDGRFRLEGIPGVQDARLLLSAPGFGPRLLRGIDLAGNAAVDLGDIALERGIPIRGRILAHDGTPIADAQLALLEAKSQTGQDGVNVLDLFRELLGDDESIDGTASAADGTFSFPAAAPGGYVVAAHKPGWQMRFSDAVSVVAGAAPPFVEIRLHEGRHLRGIVRSEAGGPVAGATVAVVDLNGGAGIVMKSQKATTGADGRFVFTTLGELSVAVFAHAPGFAPSGAWDARTGAKEIEITLRRAARIEGRVYNQVDNKPLPGVAIAVISTRDFAAIEETHTGPDGRYVVENAPTGPGIGLIAKLDGYTMVSVSEKVLTRQEGAEEAVQLAEITPGTTVTQDVPMSGGAAVSGRVIDAESGQPIAGANVALRQRGNMLFMPVSDTLRARTAADGTFEIKPVGAGIARVGARVEGYLLETPPAGSSDERSGGTFGMMAEEGVVVEVRPGITITGVVVRMRRGLDADALVVNAEGQPVSGATVMWMDPNEDFAYQLGQHGAAEPKITGADGIAKLRGMSRTAGLVVAARHPEFPTGGKITIDTTGAVPSPIKIVLQRGASIAGVVLDADGRPAPRLTLNYFANEGNIGRLFGDWQHRMDVATTDDQGRFLLDNLTPGPGFLQLDWSTAQDPGADETAPPSWPPPLTLDPAKSRFTLQAGKREEVNLQLQRTQSIEGVVTDAAGKPVAGCSINASPTDTQSNTLGGGYAETNADGYYKVTGLAPGEYRVDAFVPGGAEGPQTVSQTVKAGSANVNFRAPKKP